MAKTLVNTRRGTRIRTLDPLLPKQCTLNNHNYSQLIKILLVNTLQHFIPPIFNIRSQYLSILFNLMFNLTII
jgi:hypothetical protein